MAKFKPCDRKNTYSSSSTARRVLERQKERYPEVKLRMYECDHAVIGRHWHLTHKKERR